MKIIRIVLACAALLACFDARSAAVEERSPFAQGLWWDSTRPGSGFEIFNAGDQAMVVWYTFDAGGRPTWYTAQGATAGLGSESWPLLRHRWSGGKATYATVGSVRLEARNGESLDFNWELEGQRGMTRIHPFVLSGLRNETDRSGTWFDPSQPGWGFTFTEQGEYVGGALFTYDTAGEPTWVAGFERGRDSVELHASSGGACPACAYRAPSTRSVGRMQLQFQGENAMTLSGVPALQMPAGIALAGARLTQLSRPASMRMADRQLATFATDAALKSFLDAGMLNVSSQTGGTIFSASPPPSTVTASFSGTNVQESGVDEADLMKTDGRYVYTFAHSGYARLPAIRPGEVAGEGSGFRVFPNVPLASGPSTRMDAAGLYLHAGFLVALSGTAPKQTSPFPWLGSGGWVGGKTNVEILDAARGDSLATRWRVELDGQYVSSRRIGDRLYVISRYVPNVVNFSYGAAAGTATYSANLTTLANTPLAALLPKARVNDGPSVGLVAASSMHAPPLGTRTRVADMIVVTAIDIVQARIVQALGIVGSVDAVYTAPGNLYLASSRYDARDAYGTLLPEPVVPVTDVHQIRLGADGMSLVGSGSIEGAVGGADPDKAAFRFGEHQGRLGVVTSAVGSPWGAGAKNRLTILEPSTVLPGLLKTVSYLPNPQRPEPLGKPNEQLYGTRFVGDRLYAVTFLKVDPLYVVDLADARDPKIAGSLQIPGFSDYLHPLPGGLLLGFGKEARVATTAGDGQFAWFQGLQLTLFDVGNAATLREMQRVVVGKRGSESALLRSHRAFSALQRADGSLAIAMPARIHDGYPVYGSGDSALYEWRQSGLIRYELRGAGAAARLYALPTLVTHESPSPSLSGPFPDPGADGGRVVQMSNGNVFVGFGQFWRQDFATGSVIGPF
ncbi:MAG TPA: beta-propeller domain-containing protein [Usitatibacter sp.]|nr:beta-propeller domain-containing protein [Usitatibacter sp.]